MTTLADVVENIADQLTRTDLDSQIKAEVQAAIRFYERKPFYFTERRNGTFDTVDGTEFYSTVDFSGSAGAGTLTATENVGRILHITYAKVDQSGLDEDLSVIPYEKYEYYRQGTDTRGMPSYATLYAHQIGLWPIPSGVWTISLSAVVKPVVPSADSDESVWFDEALELITNRAARSVCIKYLMDRERANAYTILETEAREVLACENVQKMGTGKLRSTRF